jgi:dihydrofolate reductase
MEANLIDEYRFLVHPIIMGQGRRFFREGMPVRKLNLVETQTLPLGVIALFYEPVKN